MKKRLFFCLMLIINTIVCMAQTMQKHTVKRGETLENIANMYGITVAELREANPNMGEYYYVGMVLNIPEKKETNTQVPATTTTNSEKRDVLVTNTTTKGTNTQLSPQKTLHIESEDGFLNEGSDYFFLIRPKDKYYGLLYGGLLSKYCYMAINAGYGFQKDNHSAGINFGIGWGSKYRFGPILLEGSLFPYAGGSSHDEPDIEKDGKTKTKNEFSYGAQANIGIGYNIYRRKKDGGGTYLTIGYIMVAPKFKTDKMVKNGEWLVGLSTDF